MTADVKTELEQEVLLQTLLQSVEKNPKPFGRDVCLAVGTGTTDAPTWLCFDLNRAGPGTCTRQSWVTDNVDAALFLPADGSPSRVSGDAKLLKEAFQPLLGGQSPLNLRFSVLGAK